MFTRSRGRALRAVAALTISAGAFVGATGTAHAALNTYKAVSMTADGHGYATISTAGHVQTFGTVKKLGNDPVGFTGEMAGISVTGDGRGYVAISDHGQVYAYGTARYRGNTIGYHGSIMGISVTADGQGYAAISSTGDVFPFGTVVRRSNPAGFTGGMSRIAVTANGQGYVAVSGTGQVYAYGNVVYRGNPKVTSPTSVIAVTADGKGYAIAEWNGTIHAFGTIAHRTDPKGFTGIIDGLAVAADGHGYLAMSSSGQMYANNVSYLGNADPGKADPPPPPSVSPHHNDPFLVCTRTRESGGNYQINTGNGYYGAYQFALSTWNSTATHIGRTNLIGVLPSNASEYDQDEMAWALYQWQGKAPWGNRC